MANLITSIGRGTQLYDQAKQGLVKKVSGQ
jgi:hypothetical protein